MYNGTVNTALLSPNFDSIEIPVEFVVLHYTACTLERTLKIFIDPKAKKCAHFVISEDGSIWDLGNFINGNIRQGSHAGESHFTVNDQEFRGFNRFSIGIELVNLNGNIRSYTGSQYRALSHLIGILKDRFTKLSDPNRIVGHEHIAGHRGKADPGRCFDWLRMYKNNYPAMTYPERFPLCSEQRAKELSLLAQAKIDLNGDPLFWSHLNADLESSLCRK